jgi:serine/threonine-protein kinase
VTIKRIRTDLEHDPDYVKMFMDEANMMVNIHHPNVVQVLELQQDERDLYMVLEYVDGCDLQAVLEAIEAKRERIPWRIALYVAWSLLRGLAEAHVATTPSGKPLQLIHRDIAPGNVLISRTGQVKLADFGVAKAAGRLTQTHGHVVKGHLGYIAPEVLRNMEFDQRADVYCAAVLLWEMLTSTPLFTKETDQATLFAVFSEEIRPPSRLNPEVPADLDAVVLKGLARPVHLRFQSARELEGVLFAYLREDHPDELARGLGGWLTHLVKLRTPDEIAALPRPGKPVPPPAGVPAPWGGVEAGPVRAVEAVGQPAPWNAAGPGSAAEPWRVEAPEPVPPPPPAAAHAPGDDWWGPPPPAAAPAPPVLAWGPEPSPPAAAPWEVPAARPPTPPPSPPPAPSWHPAPVSAATLPSAAAPSWPPSPWGGAPPAPAVLAPAPAPAWEPPAAVASSKLPPPPPPVSVPSMPWPMATPRPPSVGPPSSSAAAAPLAADAGEATIQEEQFFDVSEPDSGRPRVHLQAVQLWRQLAAGDVAATARVEIPGAAPLTGSELARLMLLDRATPLQSTSREQPSKRTVLREELKTFFQSLESASHTGLLAVVGEKFSDSAALLLQRGRLQYVYSPFFEDTFLDVMLGATGRLDVEVSALTAGVVRFRRPVWQEALSRALVTPGELQERMTAFVEGRLWRVCAWNRWRCTFLPPANLPYDLPPAQHPVTRFSVFY